MFLNHMISRDYKLYGLSQKLLICLKLRDYLEPCHLKTLLLEKFMRILKENDRKTAVPRLRLGAKSPTRYQEVLKTEREIHRQPSSKALITMIVMRLEENLKLPFFWKSLKALLIFCFTLHLTDNHHVYSLVGTTIKYIHTIHFMDFAI